MSIEIQKLICPNPSICTDLEMYYRLENGWYDYESGTVEMKTGDILTSDTYFNSFSFSKWKAYTDLSAVDLEVRIAGDVTVYFMKSILSDGQVTDSVLDCRKVCSDSPATVTLHFDFSGEQFEGMAYLKIKAHGPAVMYGACYMACESFDREHIKPALVYCTYKREDFIDHNLRLLKELHRKHSEQADFEVYVIDNGRTLEQEKFTEPYLHLIPNKNAGGAGGFTRGMIEVLKRGGFSHIILLDDDAVMDPQVLVRTIAFLCRIREKYSDCFIGGATLRLDRKNIQLESSAIWNNNVLYNLKKDLNLKNKKSLLLNEKEESRSYHAWVFCCIPCKAVSLKDLPLPLFVRGDDMEYGMRHRNGIITMNGIGLWHAPVEGRYSFSMNYYMLRNQLVLNALYDDKFHAKQASRLLMQHILYEIVRFRYENVELYLRAYRDFLKGVKFFLCNDAHKIHQQICDCCPVLYDYMTLEKMGYPFVYEKLAAASKENAAVRGWKRLLRLIFAYGYTLPPFLRRRGRSENYGVVDLYYAHANNFFRRNTVLQIDTFGQRGVVTKRSYKKAFRALIDGFVLCGKMHAGAYQRAVRSYRKHVHKLQTVEFWEKYLETYEKERNQQS